MDEVKSCGALEESYKSPALWDKTSADIEIVGEKLERSRACLSGMSIDINKISGVTLSTQRLGHNGTESGFSSNQSRESRGPLRGRKQKTGPTHNLRNTAGLTRKMILHRREGRRRGDVRPGNPCHRQEEKHFKTKQDVTMTRTKKMKDFKNIKH